MQLHVKPGDRLIKGYYEALSQFGTLDASHEGAVRSAFQNVLAGYSKKLDWALVPEYRIKLPRAQSVVVDAAILDEWKFKHGFWEAKDEHDDLEREVRAKIERGYPTYTSVVPHAKNSMTAAAGGRAPLRSRLGRNTASDGSAPQRVAPRMVAAYVAARTSCLLH